MRRLWLGFLVVLACAPALQLPPRPERMALAPAEAERRRDHTAAPATFKLVHQVAAQFRGQTFLLTGYLLGRREGDFRVSGMAPVGPRLFDVARVHGHWETALYLDAARGRLDPIHIGRAVERIYFADADGPLRPDRGYWRSDAAIPDDDEVDAVQVWRDPERLAIVHKRFLKSGAPVLDVDYTEPDQVRGHAFARQVRLTDTRGFTLTLNVAEYVPDFPVSDEQLKLQRTGQPQTAP